MAEALPTLWGQVETFDANAPFYAPPLFCFLMICFMARPPTEILLFYYLFHQPDCAVYPFQAQQIAAGHIHKANPKTGRKNAKVQQKIDVCHCF